MHIDPQIAAPQSIYKLLIGCVVPRPVAWVSSLSEDGIPNLAPFSFFHGRVQRPTDPGLFPPKPGVSTCTNFILSAAWPGSCTLMGMTSSR
jgi:hypothetical protein